VHPREVVKLALLKSAAACIVYHNHPSGVQEPSQADELITARVKEALALIDVRLIDHPRRPRHALVRRIGTSLKC
jgi:DNA repair protein RadC